MAVRLSDDMGSPARREETSLFTALQEKQHAPRCAALEDGGGQCESLAEPGSAFCASCTDIRRDDPAFS
jgi:hypothetical protein